MSSELATNADATAEASSFDTSLAAERAAEKTLMRSIIKSIALAVPIGIAFFIGLLGLAVGDQLQWWVIIGLGTLLGLVAAVLFGALGGVTLVAHVLEDVDRGVGLDVHHGIDPDVDHEAE